MGKESDFLKRKIDEVDEVINQGKKVIEHANELKNELNKFLGKGKDEH